MRELVLVMAGGALGSGARYLVSNQVQRLADSGFPFGTLAVNALGSLVLGVVIGLSLESEAFDPRIKLAVGTGFLGGFTTWSSFGVETARLLEDGLLLQGVGNVLLQLGLGLPAAALGLWLARALGG